MLLNILFRKNKYFIYCDTNTIKNINILKKELQRNFIKWKKISLIKDNWDFCFIRAFELDKKEFKKLFKNKKNKQDHWFWMYDELFNNCYFYDSK